MLLATLMLTITLHLAVPPGQQATAADMVQAQQITTDALHWWQQHAPSPPPAVVVAPDVVSVAQPGADGWVLPRNLVTQDGEVAIWFYVNRTPFYLFPDMRAARTFGRNVMIVLDERRFAWSERATLTHELGHAIYGLDDRYPFDPWCRTIDIMCNHEAAYPVGWVGCVSLRALGGACKPVYLPLVEGEHYGYSRKTMSNVQQLDGQGISS